MRDYLVQYKNVVVGDDVADQMTPDVSTFRKLNYRSYNWTGFSDDPAKFVRLVGQNQYTYACVSPVCMYRTLRCLPTERDPVLCYLHRNYAQK